MRCFFLRSTRTEVCCCPEEKAPRVECLRNENILVTTYTRHILVENATVGDGETRRVEPFCGRGESEVSSRVTCGGEEARVFAGACMKDQYRAVRIVVRKPVNCVCTPMVVKRLRVRCGAFFAPSPTLLISIFYLLLLLPYIFFFFLYS